MQHTHIQHEWSLASLAPFSALCPPTQVDWALICLPSTPSPPLSTLPAGSQAICLRFSSRLLYSSHPRESTKLRASCISLVGIGDRSNCLESERVVKTLNFGKLDQDRRKQSNVGGFHLQSSLVGCERKWYNNISQKEGEPRTCHTSAEFFSSQSSLVDALLTSEEI